MSEMRIYQITPCPAPRMTQSDKWRKRPCVVRYFAFRDQVRLLGIEIPERVRIVFVLPMPASWSKAKRAAMDGQPHTVRPDIDNFCKAALDSVFDDDAHIWEIHASKIWGFTGAIEIGAIGE